MKTKQHIGVTGARGRIAPLVAGLLRSQGDDVTTYSRKGGYGHTALSELTDGCAEAPDCVIHCGWSTLPITAEERPQAAIEEDLPLIDRILTANPRARFVFLSSAAVYGNTGLEAATESSPVAPLGAYARGKAAAEDHVRALAPDRHLILRITNLLGHRADPARPQGVVPRLIDCALNSSPFEMWGGPETCKDYLDTADFLVALGMLIASGQSGTFNVASGHSHTLGTIVSEVERAMGRRIAVVHRPRFSWDVAESHVSPARLVADLGWAPVHTLEESVRASVAASR